MVSLALVIYGWPGSTQAGTPVTPVTVSPSGEIALEVDGTQDLTLSLGTQPSGDVTVILVATDPALMGLSTGSSDPAARVVLSFPAADWQTAQTVTLTGLAPGATTVARQVSGDGQPSYNVQRVRVATAVGQRDTPTDDCAADATTTCGMAKPTSMSSTFSGEIETPGDVDWIWVELDPRHTYEVTLSGKVGADTQAGTLTDPHLEGCAYPARYDTHSYDGRRYNRAFWHLYRDVESSNNDRALYTHLKKWATICYLTVSGNPTNGDDGTGTYTLSVTEFDPTTLADDCAMDVTTTCAAVPDGTPQAGFIEQHGDVDWVAVQLTAGKNYLISRMSNSKYGWAAGRIAAIRDKSGALLRLSYHDEEGRSWFDFSPDTTDKYYVEIRQNRWNEWHRARNPWITRGEYAFTVEMLSADAIPGDATTTSRLSVGGTVSGTGIMRDDVDWHQVSLTKNTEYVFEVAPHGLGKVDPCDPDSPERTTPYTYGEQHCLFGFPEGTDVKLDGLFDSSGQAIAERSRRANGDVVRANSYRLTYTATATGTYYIANSGAGPYKITLQTTANVPADDYPHDDSGTAVDLSGLAPSDAAVNINGVTNYIQDEDWIKVKLSSGREYKFSMHKTQPTHKLWIKGLYWGAREIAGTPDGAEGASTDQTNYCVNVWWAEPDPEKEDILWRGRAAPDDRQYCRFVVPYTGEYTLRVASQHYQVGSYRLKVVASAGSQDDYPADSSTTAVVSSSSPLRAKIDYESDHDWAKLSMQSGTGYVIKARKPGSTSTSYVHLNWQAFGTDGTRLNGRRNTLAQGDVCFEVDADGDYFVEVRGLNRSRHFVGSYDLTVTERAGGCR